MVPKSKGKKQDNEEVIAQVKRLLEEKGRETLELTKKLMLEREENIQCKEVREALHYFADNYWNDLARPTLISITYEAVGGNCKTVTPIAAPIMLITAGIDLHDDVIDQSTVKNKRSTVFGKFGKDVTLLVGDALIFKGFIQLQLALKHFQQQKAAEVLKVIEKAFFELGDAEALELRFKGRMDVTPKEYLEMVRKKAADVEAYTHVSAVLGKGTKAETEAIRKYGRILGMLAIIRDDLIDMTDEKELMHRLENEIVPLPILYAAQSAKARSSISLIQAKHQKTKEAAHRILEITCQYSGFTHAEKKVRELVEEGFLSLKPIQHKKEELRLLLNFMKTT